MRTEPPAAPPAVDTAPAAETGTPVTSDAAPTHRMRSRSALIALVLVVLGAVTLYGGAAQLVSTPRVFPDELRYALGASALAKGELPSIRGQEYGFGLAHVAVLAAVLAAVPDRETAYHLWKVANALLFALAAFPIYLLARRLLSQWWSVGVAALSLAIPSSMYVSVVMTESASYFTCLLAVLAIVLAVERPTPVRQLAAVGAIALAYATRAQFAVLFAAYLVALVSAWAIARERPSVRETLRSLWPTLAALALGVVAFVAQPLLTWSSPSESFGPYADVWRTYDMVNVARWALYHLAELDVYLAIVPLAVAPIVLLRLFAQGRQGAAPERAFAVCFVTVNGALLLITAAFASTPVGYDRLHDRYLFYVVPLWLVVLAVWLAEGMPRPLMATAVGASLALVLPFLLPFGKIAEDVGVDVVPSALWARVQEQLGAGGLNGRHVLVLFVVSLVLATVLAPRRLGLVFPGAVLAVFAVTAVFAWERIVDAPEDAVFAGRLDRAWIDDSVPQNAQVTKLYGDDCRGSALQRHALFLTEFFNSSVDRAAYIGDSVPDGIPIERVDVHDGRLLFATGAPLVADYVYTQPDLELEGRRVGTGTAAGLVLWHTSGEVRVVGARTNEDVLNVGCS